MSAGKDRKYFMVGGKGGVGKTSLSASLAVKFALNGHHTLVVSTDPAHSLSDSLAQNVGGGKPVAVEGTDGMLYGMEIDPEESKTEFAGFIARDQGKGVKDFMGSMGLGGVLDQLEDLKLGELLDTPPPGLDEAIAITKVVQFIKSEEYSKFTRIVFDTAPTGHTLRLLSLPDFLDATIGKIVRLRLKLSSAATAVKSLFGQAEADQDEAIVKLEALKSRLQEVKDLFRNQKTTEFVIVTIPTVLAISESGRLLQSLRDENVPVTRMVVNQLLRKPGASVEDVATLRGAVETREAELRALLQGVPADDRAKAEAALGEVSAARESLLKALQSDVSFCTTKRKDQERAMGLIANDAGLRSLQRIEAPLFDLEIRGVPALRFMSDQVWT